MAASVTANYRANQLLEPESSLAEGKHGHVSISRLIVLLNRLNDERLQTIYELVKDSAERSQAYTEKNIRASKGHQKPKGLVPWQLKRSISYMRQRSPKRVEVEEIAECVGLSSAHFSRGFKASIGLSPYQWQLHICIRSAQKLLLQDNRSIEEIAAQLDFVDRSHFTRVFKRIVGRTPGTWRKGSLSLN